MIDLFNQEIQYDITRKVKLIYNGKKTEKNLSFKEVSYEKAKEIIIKNHYSHKWNTSFGKINVGVFENDILLGVASYGNLMNPKSYKQFNKDFEQENIIELNRLWLDDSLGGNAETVLMKASFDIIKKKYPYILAIQSFADGRLGCGTIYKAMNFDYYGFTETLFYENIETKDTYHKVPMENTKRPDGLIKLNYLWEKNKLRPFKVKTYRYIYPLYKNVEIELEKQTYPKYDIGIEYIDNEYKHNFRLLPRSYILSYILGYQKEFNLFNDKIEHNILKEYLSEKTIVEIAKSRGVYDKLLELINKNEEMLK